MADLNPTEAASAGAATLRQQNATVMQLWQDNAGRMLRANERVLHGMMSALKLEIELGQQLVEHRLTTFKQASQADKPAAAGQTVIDRTLQEMEHLTTTLREVSEEMRKSFGEATKIIFNRQDENLQTAVTTAVTTAVETSPPVQAARFAAKSKPELPPASTASAATEI